MRRVMQAQVPAMLCAGRRIADLACNDVDAVGSVGGAGQVVAVVAKTVTPDTFLASDPSRVPR